MINQDDLYKLVGIAFLLIIAVAIAMKVFSYQRKIIEGMSSTDTSPANISSKISSSEPITKLFDAGRDDPPYNYNSYPSYDQQDQYIGLNTPLDQMFHDTGSKVSPNPMDSNWGGRAYTQKLVDEGYYKEDEVKIAVV